MNAFLYVRVSRQDQADSGLGLDAQKAKCQEYYDRVLKPKGYADGGVYVDAAVSGSKPFVKREAGGAMHVRLVKGDAIVVSKTDRAFRSLRDQCNTLALWEQKGVAVHLLDVNLDTSSAVGRVMVAILGAFAEFERARISERTKEALRRRVKSGKPRAIRGTPPKGFMMGSKGPHRVWVPHEPERQVMRKVYQLRKQGLPWDKVVWFFTIHGVMHPKTGGPIKQTYVWELYRAYLKLVASGKEDPPPGFVMPKAQETSA